MMHGRGKSDSATVAGKSANKAERLAAEPTERRGQGKCGPANHVPGTGQESVSQALERIPTSSKAKEEGTVYLAPSPHQCRSSPAGVLRVEAWRSARCCFIRTRPA
jgi:hypothetical protein